MSVGVVKSMSVGALGAMLLVLGALPAMAGVAGQVVLEAGVERSLTIGGVPEPAWFVVRAVSGGPVCCSSDQFVTPVTDYNGFCNTALRFDPWSAGQVLPVEVVAGMVCLAPFDSVMAWEAAW